MKFDASLIPPCKAELYLLRAHYISSIWKNASPKNPTILNPLEYSWEQQGTSYVFMWFKGDQLPGSVGDFIQDGTYQVILLYFILFTSMLYDRTADTKFY